jgi:hypothetical protein
MFSRRRRKNATIVAITAVAAIGFAAPVAAQSSGSAEPPAACPPMLVNQQNPAGWLTVDGVAPSFVNDAPRGNPLSPGALKLQSEDNASSNYFHDTGGPVPLGSMVHIGYSFTNTDASFQLRVRRTTSTEPTGFTTLVYVPSRNGYPPNDTSGWRTQNDLVENGKWFSSQPINGGFDSLTTGTLQQILAANPDTYALSYGVQLGGSTEAAKTAYVDDVQFGCERWDFELFSPPGPGGGGGSSDIGTGSFGNR